MNSLAVSDDALELSEDKVACATILKSSALPLYPASVFSATDPVPANGLADPPSR